MLVLSRKVGEQIVIGESIVVTVVRVNAQEVRLGVEAPAHVPILRNELCETELCTAPSGSQGRQTLG